MSTTSFGERLRRERERRNAAIEDIAGRSKIDPRYLRALEHNEFDALPGPAFGKFYIRVYAEVLGFDPEALIAEYDREQCRSDGAPAVTPPPAPEKPRRVEAAIARWREARLAEREQQASAAVEEPQSPPPDRPAGEPPPPPRQQDRPAPASRAEPAEAAEAEDPASGESVVAPASEVTEAEPEEHLEAQPEQPLPDKAVGLWEHDESAAFVLTFGAADPTRVPREQWRSAAVLALLPLGLLAVVLAVYFSLSGTSGAPPPASTGSELRAASPPAPSVPQPQGAAPVVSGPASPSSEPETRAAVSPPGRLTVSEFGVGRRIVDRRLEGQAERFEEGSVVWFLTRVLGGGRGEQIRHVWLREGSPVQTIALELGGPHWRTQSRKTLWGAGQWTVEARDSEDRVLASVRFTCVPARR